MRLPPDLAEFLGAGRQLEFDPRDAQPGTLRLRSAERLELGAVYLNGAEEGHAPGEGDEADPDDDPHVDDHGYYVIPAVDLVASAEHYPPEHILTWVPSRKMFGTWDSGHLELLVFPGVSWSDITDNPLRYVNAQWHEADDELVGVYVSPWLHGYAWEAGTPPHCQ
jgi:hypothetical protein